MNRRKPRAIKSKLYNYQVSGRHSHASPSRWIHGAIVLALIVVAAGIAYVWQRNRMINLGYTVGDLRQESAVLDKELIKLEGQFEALKRPDHIRRLVRERRLGLVPPSPGQIVPLPEPEPIAVSDAEDRPRPLTRRLWDELVLGER